MLHIRPFQRLKPPQEPNPHRVSFPREPRQQRESEAERARGAKEDHHLAGGRWAQGTRAGAVMELTRPPYWRRSVRWHPRAWVRHYNGLNL